MAPPAALTGDAFRDPNNMGFRPTHSIPKGGVFSIYADAEISAHPQAVKDAILDVAKYKEWNSVVVDVTITSHPHSHNKHLKMMEGTNMIFHIQITPDERIERKEVCSHIGRVRTLEDHDPPALTHMRWDLHNAVLSLPGFVFKAQTVVELEDLGHGKSVCRMWQTFAGMGASKFQKKYEPHLKEHFGRWVQDLKKHVESQQAAGVAATSVPEIREPGADDVTRSTTSTSSLT
jgi:hypothetical protein